MADPIIPIVVPQPYDMTELQPTQPQFWIEEIGNIEPGTVEVSAKYAHATVCGWVSNNVDQFYNFKNQMLGWHYVDTNGVLHRNDPSPHPREKNLFATKISDAKGVQFKGRGNLGHLVNGQQASQYGRMLVAIEYAPLKYNMLSDAAVAAGGTIKEYKRYLEFDPEVNIYTVSISSISTSKYAEGEAGSPGPPTPVNFAGELFFFECKETLNLTWRMVPEEYIFDTTNFEIGNAKKISLCAGRVNSTPFAGYPRGVLLLLEPKIERYIAGTLKRVDNSPVYYCDVYLPVIYFDPPLYAENPNVGVAFPPISRGHNNKPWYKQTVPKLQYYYVSSDGTATGIPIYAYEEFLKIFQYQGA